MENYFVFRQSLCPMISLILQNQSHENLCWILIVLRKVLAEMGSLSIYYFDTEPDSISLPTPQLDLARDLVRPWTQGWPMKSTHAQPSLSLLPLLDGYRWAGQTWGPILETTILQDENRGLVHKIFLRVNLPSVRLSHLDFSIKNTYTYILISHWNFWFHL